MRVRRRIVKSEVEETNGLTTNKGLQQEDTLLTTLFNQVWRHKKQYTKYKEIPC